MNKTMLSILRILEKHQDKILGSRELSRQLRQHGIELTERTVRYHLKILDERGLTKVFGKEGRKITSKGLQEMSSALVSEKVGFIISRIETLAYQTTFDVDKKDGKVILNVSFFAEKDLKEALRVMKPVFASPFVMSSMVCMAGEGQRIGDLTVPEGKVGLGTVCSVTINGIFLKMGIPVTSKFGGLLLVGKDQASRFSALISYEGSSLDPLVVFIKSRMTSVVDAVKHGGGNILASFREIPVIAVDKALDLQRKLNESGIGGIIAVGNPNQPLYEMPVSLDKAGMVVVGGLNPVAALEESGIPTDSKAMAVLYDYNDLIPFKDASRSLSNK